MKLRHWCLSTAFVLLLSVNSYNNEDEQLMWLRALPLMQHEMWHGMGGLAR